MESWYCKECDETHHEGQTCASSKSKLNDGLVALILKEDCMLKEPEKECPECKGPINWKVVYGKFGKPLYNGLCRKCNIVFKGRETPDLKKGRLMAEELVGVLCLPVVNENRRKNDGILQRVWT